MDGSLLEEKDYSSRYCMWSPRVQGQYSRGSNCMGVNHPYSYAVYHKYVVIHTEYKGRSVTSSMACL